MKQNRSTFDALTTVSVAVGLVATCWTSISLAHEGPVDRRGCHVDPNGLNYHCHHERLRDPKTTPATQAQNPTTTKNDPDSPSAPTSPDRIVIGPRLSTQTRPAKAATKKPNASQPTTNKHYPKPASPDGIVLNRLDALERENASLRQEVIDLKVGLASVEENGGIDHGLMTGTFLLTWAATSLSYAGAAHAYGRQDLMLPFVLSGAALSFLPSATTGIAAGIGSEPILIFGMLAEVGLAVLPWMIGPAIDDIFDRPTSAFR